MYDFAIVGAGIIGSFLAHELSKYEVTVALIDKNADVANGASMANSAIIHSGHDPKTGSLKARLNVRGNELYEDVCKELAVHFKRTSAFVVATSEEECITLEQLYRQSLERNIPVVKLSGDMARQKEPNLSDQVIAAIELPSTGIIYPWEVANALVEEAMLNGTELLLNTRVTGIQKKTESLFEIISDKGMIEASCVINAAGVYADEIYHMIANEDTVGDFQIAPRRGEYYVLDRLKKPLVERIIYPVPSKAGKGVLVVPTIHGNYLLGPNSETIEDKEGINNTRVALDYVKKEIQKTVKNVPMDKVIHTFSGLRPTGSTGDFVIEKAKESANFINIAGIESPGIACAPAIAEYVMSEVLNLTFKRKETYQKRRPYIDFKSLSVEEKKELLKENPTFGRVVCRCEQVTEGEILDAIRRPNGATTVKGVKKRVRPGMGRCQGGFCEPLVVEILARELAVSPLEICLDGPNSQLLVEKE